MKHHEKNQNEIDLINEIVFSLSERKAEMGIRLTIFLFTGNNRKLLKIMENLELRNQLGFSLHRQELFFFVFQKELNFFA